MYTLPLVRLQNSLQCLLLNGLVGNTCPGEAEERGLGLFDSRNWRQEMFIKVAKALCLLPWQYLWGSFCLKMCLHLGSAALERKHSCVFDEWATGHRQSGVSQPLVNCSTSDNATAGKTPSKHHYHTAWPTTPPETLSGSKKFLKPLVGDTLKAALLSSATHIITTLPSTR